MRKFWQLRAEATTNEAELVLYGDIGNYEGWNDVTAQQFARDLAELGDVDTINLRINSVGGDVFAGQAIHSMLKRHKAQVHVYVDGLAASIASVVAMAGDVVHMPGNSMMMIHNPWTIAAGNSSDFRKTAEDLDQIRESLLAAYEGKTGLARDKIIELMDAETWLTAAEAVELGFADELENEKQVAASISAEAVVMNGQTLDLSRFGHVPATLKLANTAKPRKEVMTMDEMQWEAQYPDLYAQVRQAATQEGIKAERERMQALEALAAPGCEEILSKAKYETGADARDVAMECVAVLKEAASKNQALLALHADAAALNGAGSPGPEEASEEEQRAATAAAMAAVANKMRGGK